MAKNKRLPFTKRWIKWGIVSCCAIGISLWLGDQTFPLNLKRYQDTSTLVYGQNNELLHVFLTKDEKFRIKTMHDDVPPLYIQTLLTREDRFYRHHLGVNPVSILRSTIHNLRAGRVLSGGSTLTMQTARLLEPRPRTFSTKIIECLRALQLEWHYSKDEILDIYLTLAPFGRNIEGIKAASYAYFNHSPNHLSPFEIALLVAMVQSPNQLRPEIHPQKALLARNRVLQLMQSNQLINDFEHKLAVNVPVPATVKKFPREIPHLAWRLKYHYPNQNEIESTINLAVQNQIELLLQNHRSFLPPQANAAVLILDHVQNKPIAYVASVDYLDSNHGYVDYIRAYRSPGSILKPFIYGVAFDSGLVQPDSVLFDVRKRFGSYFPKNFDKEIHGMVSTKEALASSLNIPAVDMLNEIGVIRFFSMLKEVGIEPRFPNSEIPGLSSALGGLGMSLEQLVRLYSALGNAGKIKNFSYDAAQSSEDESYLISARAATHLKDILAMVDSRDKIISVKTGTSYGHRDALAVGFDHQYVIGIWIGLPNGTPMRDETGATAAVPLLQKIHQALPSSPKPLNLTPYNHDFKLKKLASPSPSAFQEQNENLSLLFPVDNTVITLDAQRKGIPCSVRGGKRPYTWLINDKPSSPSWQQKYTWYPDGPGFYKLTVIDAEGMTVQAQLEVLC